MRPDENDRHRGRGAPLPDDPAADTSPFPSESGSTTEAHEGERGPWGADFGPVPVEWLTVAPPPRRWLLMAPPEALTNDAGRRVGRESVNGMLACGKVGLVAGAGGVGKTMAILDLAIAVATATDWLGTFPVGEPGRVLLLLGEEDRDEVYRRLYNATRDLTTTQRDLVRERVFIVALAGNSAIALTEPVSGGRSLAATSLLARLRASGPWALLILDPLSRFAGPDAEKDNAAATRIVQVVEEITQVPGNPTVIVCHHTSQASRQNATTDATAARGVTGLTDGARWLGVLTNEPDAPEFARFTVAKSNYSRIPPSILLRRGDRGRLRVATQAEHAECDAMREAGKKSRKPSASRDADTVAAEVLAGVWDAELPGLQARDDRKAVQKAIRTRRVATER